MSNQGTATRGFSLLLSVFALGAAAGAAAALLMAPRSGRETRAQLKGAALDLKRKMERAPEAIRAAGDRTMKAGAAALNHARDDVKRHTDAV